MDDPTRDPASSTGSEGTPETGASENPGTRRRRPRRPRIPRYQPKPGWFDAVMPQPGSPLASGRWLMVLAGFATLALSVVQASLLPSLYGVLVPTAFVVTALHAGTVVLALTRPWASVITSTLSVAITVPLAVGGTGHPWPIPVTTLLLVTLTCLVLSIREPWPLATTTAAIAVLVATVWGYTLRLILHAPPVADNLVTFGSVLILVVAFGLVIRQWVDSRSRAIELQQRAETEAERRQVVEERSRIARELHDVVAHSLSIISIQASTVRYRIDDVPEPVIAELEDITDSAREALVEMRGLLQVLRQEDADRDLAPQPTINRVEELVESTRRSSRTVQFHVTGDLEDPAITEVASLSAYRIVQESLSNAVRHAPDSEITVRLAVTDRELTIHVENSRPSQPGATSSGSGLGLRGMRERAAAAGGRVRTGPTDEGGYLVRAELPLRH